jgi:hypothetical protein
MSGALPRQGVLDRLAAALRTDGGLMAEAVADAGSVDGTLGAAAAAGPRAAGREEDYALLVEAIVEGYLQHYGTGRVMRPADPDLALLAGDRLYALGLEKLAAEGDLEAIGVLCETIATCARSHAEGAPEQAQQAWQDASLRLARRPRLSER